VDAGKQVRHRPEHRCSATHDLMHKHGSMHIKLEFILLVINMWAFPGQRHKLLAYAKCLEAAVQYAHFFTPTAAPSGRDRFFFQHMKRKARE